MTRQILRPAPSSPPGVGAAPAVPAPPDQYKDRLLKYIPADVTAIYLTLTGIVASAASNAFKSWLPWAVFLVIWVLTPFYIRHIGKVTDRKQIVVGTVAFFIWALGIGAPFDASHIPWYDPIIGAVLIPFFTFLIPLTD